MSQSRYIKYSPRTLPKQKRTISVWGAETRTKDLSGKLFKCWNCGFICNTDRDELGDGVGYTVVGTNYTFSIKKAQGGYEDVTETDYSQVVSSGCPFCGSRNYA